MINMCPHCGYNLQKDEPIELGDWSLHEDGVSYRGVRLLLTASQVRILYTMAKATGSVVRHEVIYNRVLDNDVADPRNNIAVQISKIRDMLAGMGVSLPIENVRAVGYRWAA